MKSNQIPSSGYDASLIFIGTEQPESCRYCSMRTDLDELENGLQLHHCTLCNIWYLVEFEDDADF